MRKRRFSRVQGFFEILELKFISVNEYFKISKVTKKLALVKNAKILILKRNIHKMFRFFYEKTSVKK